MSIQSFLRSLQGEAPGMKAGGPHVPATFIPPVASLWIETSVQLADVSFWQGLIDWNKMRAAGLAGVIIRAGQRTWVDSRFKANWAAAKEAGLPRGSYWFYDSREDPKRQAEIWASLLSGDAGELVHVADFEENYGGPYGKREHFKAFLAEFQRLSGLPAARIAIYTGFYYWRERVGNDPWFKQFQLWLAWYAPMITVQVPLPWEAPDLLFWQYTSSGPGPEYGVSSQEIDLNYYCCSPAAFARRFDLREEPMTDYIYSITPAGTLGSKVRPEPDTGNTSNLVLPYGRYAYGNRRVTIAEDKFEGGVQVNRAGDVWLEVLEVNGTLLSQPGYVAEIHLGTRYATITQINQPPPDPEPSPTLPDLPYTITLGDDITYARQTIQGTLKPKA